MLKVIISLGEVAERLNAAVLKTAKPKGFVGSNPTLSANVPLDLLCKPFDACFANYGMRTQFERCKRVSAI